MKKWFIKCTANSINNSTTIIRFLGKEKNITNPSECTEVQYAKSYGYARRAACAQLLERYKNNVSINESRYGKSFNYEYEIIEVVL